MQGLKAGNITPYFLEMHTKVVELWKTSRKKFRIGLPQGEGKESELSMVSQGEGAPKCLALSSLTSVVAARRFAFNYLLSCSITFHVLPQIYVVFDNNNNIYIKSKMRHRDLPASTTRNASSVPCRLALLQGPQAACLSKSLTKVINHCALTYCSTRLALYQTLVGIRVGNVLPPRR